jgi:hypothetical protein
MHSPSTRVFLGCVAGALAMLMFHQTTLQAFYWSGLAPHPAFRIAIVPPFNVPMVVSVTFWGAVYGGLFGWVYPRLPGPYSLRGALAGVFAILMAWFVMRPLAGHPVAFAWKAEPMALSAAANLMWGFGCAAILPVINPRCLLERSRAWAASRHLAT